MLKTPICLLTVDNKPLNDVIQQRILSVTVTDNRADEADQLDIVLDDSDGKLQLPKRGVTINCKLGFTDTKLTDKGDFTFDGIEWSGPPDIITIKAASANFKSGGKVAKTKSYHQKNLGDIASTIAKDNELDLKISDDLSSRQVQHIDQTNESDLNFLRRLTKQNGAEMAIKKDRLLIFEAGTAKTASGKDLPTFTISKSDGDQYRYAEEDRESDYTGVSAYYRNDGKKTRQRVTAGDTEDYGGGNDSSKKTKVLKGTFASKEEAQKASDAAMQSKERAMAKFSFNTAIGRPEITSEMPVSLQSFKTEIDGLKWIVDKARHTYSDSGLTTQLELESKL